MLYAKLAGARLYPSVDVLARGGGKLSGDGSGLQGAVLIGDVGSSTLWGRVRYGRAAARPMPPRRRPTSNYARQSIAARVAKSWFLATEAGLQAELARQHHPRQRGSWCGSPRTARRIGVGNEEDVYVARAQRRRLP